MKTTGKGLPFDFQSAEFKPFSHFLLTRCESQEILYQSCAVAIVAMGGVESTAVEDVADVAIVGRARRGSLSFR